MWIYAFLGALTGISINPFNFVPAFIIGAVLRNYIFAILGALVLGAALSIAALYLNQRYGGTSPQFVPAQIISTLALTSIAFAVRRLLRKPQITEDKA